MEALRQGFSPKGIDSIVEDVRKKGRFDIQDNKAKIFGWFALTNAAVILTITILTQGEISSGFFLFLLALGSIFPLISLLFSKTLAIKAHAIHLIGEDAFQNNNEERLFRLVESLSTRAGLETMPEVGIYQSEDMNAFATGRSKNDSLVAFSSGLLAKMDDPAVAGVAAHEIAHIANGDMLTLALVQAVVNALILLVTIPLKVVKVIALFSDDVDVWTYWLVSAVKFVATIILVFLGSLVVKFFSRHREFKADKLASELIDKDCMVGALQALKGEVSAPPQEQAAFAAFKINSPSAWLDIFSTHPSLDRRIEALNETAA